MKRILFILFLLPALAFGQVITHVSYAYPVAEGGGGEPVSNMLQNGDFSNDTTYWELNYGDTDALSYSANRLYYDNSGAAELVQLADSMNNPIQADDSIQFRLNLSGFSTPRTAITIRDYPVNESFSSGATFDNGWNEINYRVPDYYGGVGSLALFILDYEDFYIEEVQVILIERP